jgi:hypothetical protein
LAEPEFEVPSRPARKGQRLDSSRQALARRGEQRPKGTGQGTRIQRKLFALQTPRKAPSLISSAALPFVSTHAAQDNQWEWSAAGRVA